ncbi:MAG: FliI/YscN family ATPase [Woeseiaceae bacterium]
MTGPNRQVLPEDEILRRISAAPSVRLIGRVTNACGTTIRISGLPVAIGQTCRIYQPEGDWQLRAEVIGMTEDGAILQPFGHLRGLSTGARVEVLGTGETIAVGQAILGRIVNAAGEFIDGKPAPELEDSVPIIRTPPAALTRAPVDEVVSSGIAVIDTLLTCAKGQRFGIFAPAGAGKSTLLGMLAANSTADVNVIALIGERGREVLEFIESNLAAIRERTVVVVATSDEPSLVRARAAYTATAIAEYFRDQGLHVQLLADSLTRYARALRDVGLAMGEPSTRSGFPPSVFSELPQLLERAGTNDKGAITAFYTMLVEDEDELDPIAEETVSILDGHIVLSRRLAMQAHYPAVDVLASVSRSMPKIVDANHSAAAARARALIGKYRSLELILQMGEFEPGHDADADAALAAMPRLQELLKQTATQRVTFEDSVSGLYGAVGLKPPTVSLQAEAV